MLKGIDVYVGNGVISWTTVKNAGYDFAMIKATQGHGASDATKKFFCFTDSKFKTNIEAAYKAGFAIGVYHYFTALTEDEVDKEAAHFIKTIEPYKNKIKLWAAVDVEDPNFCGNLDKMTLTKYVKRFMNILAKAGYKPMLYTNPNYIQYKFTYRAFSANDVWLAHYGVSQPYPVENMQMWQYAAIKIPGCSTKVDVNYGYYDESMLMDATVTAQSTVKIIQGARYKAAGTNYADGVPIPASVRARTFTIAKIMTFGGVDCALLNGINSWVAVKYLEQV